MSNELNQALDLVRQLDTKCDGIINNLGGLDRAKFEKAQATLDAVEVKNQNLVKELAEERKSREELVNRLNSLEADLKRGIGGEEKQAKTQELKSFENLVKKGSLEAKSLKGNEEFKYLRTDNNEQGGYLAPTEYANEIIKKITEISPVRQVARILNISGKELKVAKRNTLVSGGWVGEGASATASQSSYGEETLRAEALRVYVDISMELLRDSAYDMRGQITSDISESFAQLEGAAFVNGNGVNKPEGLLTNGNVGYTPSTSASALTGDCLYEAQGFIPSGYNLTWMLNKKTFNKIRVLKDLQGQYLFQQGLGTKEVPSTIAGLPYVIANDMPDVASDTFPIILGDFFKAYYIADNQAIEFVEDPLTQAIYGKRRFIAYKRVGGQVVLPEAVRKIKISIS